MKTTLTLGCLTLVVASVPALGAVSSIDSLALAPRWYNDFPGSTQNFTNNGLTGVEFQESNFTTGGYTNRNYAALSVGGTPYSFGTGESWRFDVDVSINSVGTTEAGIQVGTVPFFPSSFNANVGQFDVIPASGEIAAFGGVLPFFSNNQMENSGMARAAYNTTFHLTLIYNGTNDGAPSMYYGVNGVFTPLENAGGTFPGLDPASSVGVFEQGPNGTTGDVDVVFSNLTIQGIPAPTSLALLGLGGLVGLRRRR